MATKNNNTRRPPAARTQKPATPADGAQTPPLDEVEELPGISPIETPAAPAAKAAPAAPVVAATDTAPVAETTPAAPPAEELEDPSVRQKREALFEFLNNLRKSGKHDPTRLDVVLNDKWFLPIVPANEWDAVEKLFRTHEGKTKANGFDLKTVDGHTISWRLPDEKNGKPEMISGPRFRFNETDASAIVELAKMRGWKSVNVHGNKGQKEKLWLAVQRQNLRDYALFLQDQEQKKQEFERQQAEGKIPADAEFKPAEFQPIVVTNFSPLANSAVVQQYMREAEAFQKLGLLPGLPGPNLGAPAITMGSPLPPAPEAPAEDTKAEAPASAAPPAKAPEETKAAAPAPAAKSQFVETPPAAKPPLDFTPDMSDVTAPKGAESKFAPAATTPPKAEEPAKPAAAMAAPEKTTAESRFAGGAKAPESNTAVGHGGAKKPQGPGNTGGQHKKHATHGPGGRVKPKR